MLDVYLDPSAIAIDPAAELPAALPEPETVRAARGLRQELEEARHLKPAQASPPHSLSTSPTLSARRAGRWVVWPPGRG